eukprot:PhF_6_TR12865/c0_g1_i2/m.20216
MSYQPYHNQEHLDMKMKQLRTTLSERSLQQDQQGLPFVFSKYIAPKFCDVREPVLPHLTRATFSLPDNSTVTGKSSALMKKLVEINDYQQEAFAVYVSKLLEENCEDIPSLPETSLTLMDVEGDGYCMLYAISTALIGDQSLWYLLRHAINYEMTQALPTHAECRDRLVKALPREGELTARQWDDLIHPTTRIFDADLSYDVIERRSLEAFHMYVLSCVLKRPIIFLDDNYPHVFLPFVHPPAEWGPALLYGSQTPYNLSMASQVNHFVAVLPKSTLAIEIPFRSLLNASTNTIHVWACCVQAIEYTEEELKAVVGKDVFSVQPHVNPDFVSLRTRLIAEVSQSFPPQVVAETYMALMLRNPLEAILRVGESLTSFIESSAPHLLHCVRCTAPVLLTTALEHARSCNHCNGTIAIRYDASQLLTLPDLRQKLRRAACLQVKDRRVCFTWVDDVSDPATLAAQIQAVVELDPIASVVLHNSGRLCDVFFNDGNRNTIEFQPPNEVIMRELEVAIEAHKKGSVLEISSLSSASTYLWLSMDPRTHEWIPYENQIELESAFLSRVPEVMMVMFGRRFTLDFEEWRQYNDVGYSRPMRRLPEGKWRCSNCTFENIASVYCTACRKPLTIKPVNDPYLGPGGYFYSKVTRKPYTNYILPVYAGYSLYHYDTAQDRLVEGSCKEWECVQCGHANPMSNIHRCEKCIVGEGDPSSDPRLVYGGPLFQIAGNSSQKCVNCKIRGSTSPCSAVQYGFPESYGDRMFVAKELKLVPVVIAVQEKDLCPGGIVYEYIKKTKGLISNCLYSEKDFPPEFLPDDARILVLYRMSVDKLLLVRNA